MKKTPTLKTAAELMAELEADPEWVARRDAAERERKQREAVLEEEERELVYESAAAGIEVDSVWDLVQTTPPYHRAVPILVRHLARPYSPRTREGIARALTTPEARHEAWEPLIELYRATQVPSDPLTESLKDAAANAIGYLAGKERVRTLVHLAMEEAHGDSRVFLVEALGRIGDASVIPFLEELVARGVATRPAKQAVRAILRRTNR